MGAQWAARDVHIQVLLEVRGTSVVEFASVLLKLLLL